MLLVLVILLSVDVGLKTFKNPPQVASTATPTPPTTFCLAMDLPLSGIDAAAGGEVRNGIELALAQSSLPLGYHLDEFQMNDASQAQGARPGPTVGVENVQGLSQATTSCPNPIAVIGPVDSSLAIEEIPVAAKEHLLLLSSSNTAPCLTQKSFGDSSVCVYNLIHPQGFPNTYARLPGTDIDQGYQDADFLGGSGSTTNVQQRDLGARRIVVAEDEEVYGMQITQAVIQRLQQIYGLTPVEIDCVKLPDELSSDPSCSLNPSEQAFSTDNLAALAAKIAKANPDAIFFGGFTDRGAGSLRHQLGLAGLGQKPFVGGDALISDGNAFFKAASPYTANIYATFPAADPATFAFGSPTEATFFSQYHAMFQVDPTGYSANGYDAANIIIQSITDLIKMRQPVTSANVAQTVLNNDFGKDFVGIAGNRIHFDQNGDNIGQRQYTIEQSEQRLDGTIGWMDLTVEQVS